MFDIKDIMELLVTNPDEFMRLMSLEPLQFSLEFAEYLDANDSLMLRPFFDLGAVVPFAGHSLGPAYLPAKVEIDKIYNLQRDQLHAGHFPDTQKQSGNWFDCDIEEDAIKAMQGMLGFEEVSEFVFSQAGLSANLGNLMSTFYRPTATDGRLLSPVQYFH